jgi:hypothetical protein
LHTDESRRGNWFAIAVVVFGVGWLLGAFMPANRETRNQYLTLDKEQQEDERELELIRKVSIGDSIDQHTELLMLADIVLTTSEPDFNELFEYLAEKSPDLPPALECQIWDYDLFNLELEGTRQYFLIIHAGRIVAICPGYSVTL